MYIEECNINNGGKNVTVTEYIESSVKKLQNGCSDIKLLLIKAKEVNCNKWRPKE